jgi:hypothetical protein
MARSREAIWDAYSRVITSNQTTREQNDALYQAALAESAQADAAEADD